MTRRRFYSLLILALSLFILADQAAACSRCGLFNRRCRAVRTVRVAEHAAPIQQSVNIFNAYPAGNTLYTVASQAQLYSLNPALAVTVAGRVAESAHSALAAAITGGISGNQQIAQLQALQEYNRGALAALSSSAPPAYAESLKIEQSHAGQSAEYRRDPPSPPAAAAAETALDRYCANCHGPGRAEPAAGLFIHTGAVLQPADRLRALRALETGTMPKEHAPLTPEQQAAVRAALLELDQPTQ